MDAFQVNWWGSAWIERWVEMGNGRSLTSVGYLKGVRRVSRGDALTVGGTTVTANALVIVQCTRDYTGINFFSCRKGEVLRCLAGEMEEDVSDWKSSTLVPRIHSDSYGFEK